MVKRITAEPQGLALWVLFPRTRRERRYLLGEARHLLASTPEGILRNELSDALQLCRGH